jgi:hypothetical protein
MINADTQILHAAAMLSGFALKYLKKLNTL